jgi:hypothetical protein
MLGSAVRTLKAHHIEPNAGQGRVVNVNLKVNRLSGLTAPTHETAHRLARKSQEKQGRLLAAFLLHDWLHCAR